MATIYIIEGVDYDYSSIDSIWFSKQKAEARLAEILEKAAEHRRSRKSPSDPNLAYFASLTWEIVEHTTEDEVDTSPED